LATLPTFTQFHSKPHQSPFKACDTGCNSGTYRVFALRFVRRLCYKTFALSCNGATTKRSQFKRVPVVLSADFIAATPVALIRALSIERPVYCALPKSRRRVPFRQIESRMNDSEFTRTFRMPREAFHSLCRTLRMDLPREESL
jgi:hypothetical protein